MHRSILEAPGLTLLIYGLKKSVIKEHTYERALREKYCYLAGFMKLTTESQLENKTINLILLSSTLTKIPMPFKSCAAT